MRKTDFTCLIIFPFFNMLSIVSAAMDHGIELPTKCEVCRVFVHEFLLRLQETNSSDYITLGDSGVALRKIKYDRSELRFIEVLQDPPLCHRMLKYKLHKERQGCNRFDKTISETQKSLTDLADRGVTVQLDVPLDMWDKPSVEISSLTKQCYSMVSAFEDALEDWFYNLQGEVDLLDYFCRDRVLKDSPKDCLQEEFRPHDENSGTHSEL